MYLCNVLLLIILAASPVTRNSSRVEDATTEVDQDGNAWFRDIKSHVDPLVDWFGVMLLERGER